MTRFLTSLLIAAASSSLLAHAGWAGERNGFTCSNHRNDVRKIAVRYDSVAKPVPCSVVYTKEDKTEKKLWSAALKEGYCEEKAQTFAEKLHNAGWKCSATEREKSQ